MYGRAGRRGLDDSGFALVTDDPPRLQEARARHLRRATQVDWPTLVAVMAAAAERGDDPCAPRRNQWAALFRANRCRSAASTRSRRARCRAGCGRYGARALRPAGVVEMRNSRGEWEPRPAAPAPVPLGTALVWDSASESWKPALSLASTLNPSAPGSFAGSRRGRPLRAGSDPRHPGRRRPRARSMAPPHAWAPPARSDRAPAGSHRSAPATRRWRAPGKIYPRGDQLAVILAYDRREVPAWIDAHGAALLDPPTREELPRPAAKASPARRARNSRGAAGSDHCVAGVRVASARAHRSRWPPHAARPRLLVLPARRRARRRRRARAGRLSRGRPRSSISRISAAGRALPATSLPTAAALPSSASKLTAGSISKATSRWASPPTTARGERSRPPDRGSRHPPAQAPHRIAPRRRPRARRGGMAQHPAAPAPHARLPVGPLAGPEASGGASGRSRRTAIGGNACKPASHRRLTRRQKRVPSGSARPGDDGMLHGAAVLFRVCARSAPRVDGSARQTRKGRLRRDLSHRCRDAPIHLGTLLVIARTFTYPRGRTTNLRANRLEIPLE